MPVFSDYDADRLPRVTSMVMDLLDQDDGLEALFGLIMQIDVMLPRSSLCEEVDHVSHDSDALLVWDRGSTSWVDIDDRPR